MEMIVLYSQMYDRDIVVFTFTEMKSQNREEMTRKTVAAAAPLSRAALRFI